MNTYKFGILLLTSIFVSCKHVKIEPENPVLGLEEVSILSLIPSQSVAGSDLLIKGTGFSSTPGNNLVKIGNITATISSATDTSLLVIIPENATSEKITVVNGSKQFTTSLEYGILPKSYTDYKIKSYQENTTGTLFEFTYGSNNKIIARKESFVNPINKLLFVNGVAEYGYGTNGLLEKEIYTPTSNPNLKTVIEYVYVNQKLDSDKVYTLNVTTGDKTTTSTHNYTIIGRQLIKKISFDNNSVQTSIEDYEYSIVDGVPKVVRKINSASAGISTETYLQHKANPEPYALLVPGSPRPFLFFARSATFSNPAIKNYATTYSEFVPQIIMPTQQRYQYADGTALNLFYSYHN